MAKIPIKILDSKDVKNFNSPDITCFNFDVLDKTLQFCCKITEEQARLADKRFFEILEEQISQS